VSATISADDWLVFIGREYIDEFISEGGSSVKFVVPLQGITTDAVAMEFLARAKEHDFICASLDSATSKAHLIDQLYFGIAQQVPWVDSVRRVLRNLAAEAGYRVPDRIDDEHRLVTRSQRQTKLIIRWSS
jgi:hypothetical protein